jgi:membrane-bound lytic murein transglycosylase B
MTKVNTRLLVSLTSRAALGGAALTIAAFALAAPAAAVQCSPKGGFPAFIADFKKEAASKGISARGLAALDGLTLDDKVLAADKRQNVFNQTFEQFSGRMISPERLSKGQKLMLQHAAVLKRAEQEFGVPGAVVVAIWGLETDYGVNQGKYSIVRSVATLAYDCRRTDKFQGELADALRIIDRGDMTAAEMQGDWAGEIGQTQFLPSSYVKYAVDFDGNGKRDLARSVPDVLASTANYLKGKGWQRGAGWGPGQPNFEVIKEWNKADVYARTIALFAQKLDGTAPAKSAQAEKPATTGTAPHSKR